MLARLITAILVLMEFVSPEILALLIFAATLAGLVDAIAGGGGLIALPALLWAGIPPLQALATNKLQGTFGTATASFHFIRKGEIDPKTLLLPIVLTFAGSAGGTLVVQYVASDWLEQIVPILLIGFAIYFLLSPRMADEDAQQRLHLNAFAVLIGFGVGFYDGFFGPGTGTFFAAGFVMLLGYNLRRATAGTKLLNFTSNIASLLFFAWGGHVLWAIGLSMAAGQIVGAWVGSHLVIRHGAALIRPVLVVVSIAVSLKLLMAD